MPGKDLNQLLKNNGNWSRQMTDKDPGFFENLAHLQAPKYLWIGCSDSRVPANEIVGLLPGELFVHRNVANVVVHTDLNCLSVLQYAVEVLKVEHIIVCGHYHCGGVLSALHDRRFGLIDNWLRHIKDVREKHGDHIRSLPTLDEQGDSLCELNVIEQAINICQTTIVQDAWQSGQSLAVHSWIYGLSDGLLRDLGMCITNLAEMNENYQRALSQERFRHKDPSKLPSIVH